MILSGLILRIFLLVYTENRLDFDETTVGIMALNIFERKDYPIAFYGTNHNIGGAVEAYIAAILFASFCVSPLMIKLSLVIIWGVTAVFFVLLTRKILSASGTLCAVGFFCFPSLFFIDFSMKARGGFAETVFCSVLLMWLAVKLCKTEYKPSLSIVFGVACGIAVFISEMNVILIGCLCLWLFYAAETNRLKFIQYFIPGFAFGLIPILSYNFFIVSGANVKQAASISILKALLEGKTEHLLSFYELFLSFNFIFWPSAIGIVFIMFFALIKIYRKNRSISKEFGFVLFAYIFIFTIAYLLHGHRYEMSIPSSRVLYSLYPAIACLFGYAACSMLKMTMRNRFFISLALFLWIVPVLYSAQFWFFSRKPLSHGSWYGKWSFVDGKLLYDLLRPEGIRNVFCSYHIASPFIFTQRLMLYKNSSTPRIKVHIGWNSSFQLNSKVPIAIVGFPNSEQMKEIQTALRSSKIKYKCSVVDNMMILFDINAGQLQKVTNLPGNMNAGVMPLPDSNPGGFN